ncbi:hypothetical protein SISSUDRAFT_1122715 [Sistotremastrum suecicum HHB10207 ss-3]|uniref:F-box domain-containing protein n=1 Tax=Sistotremastrum suecicum HHB10207 ss-3 TaxID=1314776 RepID=A0A165YXF9_9AGAM|nr:hypothetical protein SISSUDRAFT_1122715 [Sistotremastrum suecicum HHB10207 ss-3]
MKAARPHYIVRRRAPPPLLTLPAELILKTLDGLTIEDVLSMAQSSAYLRAVIKSSIQVWLNASDASSLVSSLPISVRLPSSSSSLNPSDSSLSPRLLLAHAARLSARSHRFLRSASNGSIIQPRHSAIFRSAQFADLQILSISPCLYFFFSRKSRELIAYFPDEERFINVGDRLFEESTIKYLDCEMDRRSGRVLVAVLVLRNVRNPVLSLEVYSFTISMTRSAKARHATTALIPLNTTPLLSLLLPPSSFDPSHMPRSPTLAVSLPACHDLRASPAMTTGIVVLPSAIDILLVNLSTGRSVRWMLPCEDANIISANLNPSTSPSSSSLPEGACELVIALSTPSEVVLHSIPLPSAFYDPPTSSKHRWIEVKIDRGVYERGKIYAVKQHGWEPTPKILNIRSSGNAGRTWSFDVIKPGTSHHQVLVHPSADDDGIRAWKATDVPVDGRAQARERYANTGHNSAYMYSSQELLPEHAMPHGSQPRVRKMYGLKPCFVKGHDGIVLTPVPVLAVTSTRAVRHSSTYMYIVGIKDFIGPDSVRLSSRLYPALSAMIMVEMKLVIPQLSDDREEDMDMGEWRVVGWDTIGGRVVLSSSSVGGGICVLDY